jgi:hypothetical protein
VIILRDSLSQRAQSLQNSVKEFLAYFLTPQNFEAISPFLDEAPRSSARACHSDELIDVWPARCFSRIDSEGESQLSRRNCCTVKYKKKLAETERKWESVSSIPFLDPRVTA